MPGVTRIVSLQYRSTVVCNSATITQVGRARSRSTWSLIAEAGLGYLNLSLEGVKVNSVDYLLVACVYASAERC